MRPVERVAGSVIGDAGGGVLPANRGLAAMFGDHAPIWKFIEALGAKQDPVAARMAAEGHFLIEVYPALALTGLSPDLSQRNGLPKHNPANRKKFRLEDWKAVSRIVGEMGSRMGIVGLASWANRMAALLVPNKSDQDKLDAVLCALVGLIWRRHPARCSMMIGDLGTGYMETPVSPRTRAGLQSKNAALFPD